MNHHKISKAELSRASQKMQDCYLDADVFFGNGSEDIESLSHDLGCDKCAWIEICDVIKEIIIDHDHTRKRFSEDKLAGD